VTGRAGSAPTLRSRAGRTAAFRPKRPGAYKLRFTADTGDDEPADVVKLTAVPPNPLVPIDTIVGDAAHPGMKIGSAIIPADPPGPGQAVVQVVVLERSSLAVVSNKSYTGSLSQITSDLTRLDASDLVIVSQRSGPNVNRSGNLEEALRSIGTPDSEFNASEREAYSAIGVPGMARGDADVRHSKVEPLPDARFGPGLKGYLTPDAWKDYGYVPSARIPFSYGPDEQPPCRSGCDGRVGFLVTWMNSYTLDAGLYYPDLTQFYNTNGEGLTPGQQSQQAQNLAFDLLDVDADHLITIQTVTQQDGDRLRAPVGRITAGAMNDLAAGIAKVGGTRNAFNQAATMQTTGALAYTLVGWGNAGERSGAEAVPGLNGAPRVPTLRGVLRPDRESRFRPSLVTYDGSDADSLTGVIMQPPQHDWPSDDDRGVRRAIAYIGSTDTRLSSDPRTAYWTNNWSESTTNAIIDGLRHLEYPTEPATIGGPGGPPAELRFTRAEFETARSELIKELGWVGRVRSYMHDVARPFSDNALGGWAAAHKIADDISTPTHNPKDETVYNWLDFTEILLDMAAPVTDDATGVLASMLEMGVWIAGATKPGVPTDREFQVKADELGDRLISQAEQTALTYDRMADIIVSDPAKLALFGRNAGCTPANDNKCPPEFAWNTDRQLRAAANVYRGVERFLYEELVPLGYRVFQLNPLFQEKSGAPQIFPTSPLDFRIYKCYQPNRRPWESFPTLASTTLVRLLDPTTGTRVFQPLVLAEKPGTGVYVGTPPPADMLERMFDPVAPTNDPKRGGLGIHPEELMGDAEKFWWYKTEDTEKANCIFTNEPT